MLVDDHPLFREGIRSVIMSHPNFTVAAEASGVAEALSKARMCSLDLIITDLRLHSESGLDLVSQVAHEFPTLPVLVLSMMTEGQEVVRAVELGAKGYITKSASRDELLGAMQSVLQGQNVVAPEVAQYLFRKVREPVNTAPGSQLDLTARERAILEALGRGISPQEVSQELFLSVATVKTHMRSLYRKMDVSSRTQLVLKALELNLLPAVPK